MDDAMQIAEDLLDGRFQEKFDRLLRLNEDLEREYEKTPSMKERDKSEEKIEKLLYDITKLQKRPDQDCQKRTAETDVSEN